MSGRADLLETFRTLSGSAPGPADLASRHGHYASGTAAHKHKWVRVDVSEYDPHGLFKFWIHVKAYEYCVCGAHQKAAEA